MEKLIEDIKRETAETEFFTGIDHLDKNILDAIASIDRGLFVLDSERSLAYGDFPLGIGFGQTISQPFIVALITQLANPKPEHKVLEVGSGSGYQLAILAKLANFAYGIEIVPELCEMAKENLKKASITNASVVTGDGTKGLPEEAPFDRIIVSAAASELPVKLFDQLAINGIMVIPKKLAPYDQMLMRITKMGIDQLKTENILPVRFVPLVNS